MPPQQLQQGFRSGIRRTARTRVPSPSPSSTPRVAHDPTHGAHERPTGYIVRSTEGRAGGYTAWRRENGKWPEAAAPVSPRVLREIELRRPLPTQPADTDTDTVLMPSTLVVFTATRGPLQAGPARTPDQREPQSGLPAACFPGLRMAKLDETLCRTLLLTHRPEPVREG